MPGEKQWKYSIAWTYEVYHDGERKHLYFPKELSLEDKKQMIQNYINSDSPNLNYLQIIENIQDNQSALVIGDRIRLQAQKKVQIEQERLFERSSGITSEIVVIFGDMKNDEPDLKVEGSNITCKYNINWMKENLDEPTLLNNFIYWFGFVDLQWRITLVENNIHKGVFERFLFI